MSLPGRVAIDPNYRGGRPHFRGTRVPVYVVLEMLANREKPKEILSEYPNLTAEDLRDALMYAKQPAEIPGTPIAVGT
ncbi:MAG: DUF433 domain-containing protein [Nitrospirae bacterium]|nr:DUF433 domain-containing protein [Nitrospirota bacterium]